MEPEIKGSLDEAISEAERFLKRAKSARKSFRKEPASWDDGRPHEVWSGREMAAARRASLDLSNTLADLRKARS